jgi:Flp pilus assembly protein TadD
LEAYEESLKIRRKLAADDPSNAERLRDVSVSLNKVGDVLRTRGDLSGALEVYEEDLKIARKLAADDPSNAERQIDLGISLVKLGQMADLGGELGQACHLFREAGGLFSGLSARAPDHQRLKTLVEIAASEAARVCG